MVIAGASLAGLPLVTAGFFSKEEILQGAWAAETGGVWLWGAGVVGALLTGLYITRLIVLAFLGDRRVEAERRPGFRMALPMVVLAALSVVGGWLPVTAVLGPSLGETAGQASLALEAVAVLAALVGIGVAWGYRHRRAPLEGPVVAFFRDGWGFDSLYDLLLVRPFTALARLDRDDVIARPFEGLAAAVRFASGALVGTQTGRVRLYAAGIAAGAAVILALVLL
jgi:NADH-quinone oxidoreductase subunit L